MRKLSVLILFLASMICAQSALATDGQGSAWGRPVSTMVMVSFPDSGTTFLPPADVAAVLEDARNAAMVYINGRTSTNHPSARDEILALKRALSARKYLIDRLGVAPQKIMINFVSAADYVTENITPEGRYANQRVEVELIYIPML